MTIQQKLENLAGEQQPPCITISLNTHRTHPDNKQDEVILKNLLKEAEERLLAEFGKRPVASLLDNLRSVSEEVDVNHNLDSLHVFLSTDTKEIVKSAWPVQENAVYIDDAFAIRPLIKAYNRSALYWILLLSQSGVHLYEAMNDAVIAEIRNDDFPFSQTRHYITHADKASDPKQVDNMVREFFNKVDKAVVNVHEETGMNGIVVSTENNYSHLLHVADKPEIYLGRAAIDYNKVAPHHLAGQSWALIQTLQQKRRAAAVEEVQQAVAQGKVSTDLQEIFQASIDGRGDLLIVNQDYAQPVMMTSDRTFDLVADPAEPGAIDDIVSNIAWEVLSKKGRVVFAEKDALKDLGDIVIKRRY